LFIFLALYLINGCLPNRAHSRAYLQCLPTQKPSGFSVFFFFSPLLKSFRTSVEITLFNLFVPPSLHCFFLGARPSAFLQRAFRELSMIFEIVYLIDSTLNFLFFPSLPKSLPMLFSPRLALPFFFFRLPLSTLKKPSCYQRHGLAIEAFLSVKVGLVFFSPEFSSIAPLPWFPNVSHFPGSDYQGSILVAGRFLPLPVFRGPLFT